MKLNLPTRGTKVIDAADLEFTDASKGPTADEVIYVPITDLEAALDAIRAKLAEAGPNTPTEYLLGMAEAANMVDTKLRELRA